MTIDATAQALATEEALPEQVAETPEQTEDGDLSAVWDKLNEEKPAETPDEPEVETVEEPKAETDDEAEDDTDEGEEKPAEVETPTDLPKALRDAWKDLPDTARQAVLDSQREMGRKLSEQGRLVQGIAPIRDVLVNASKEIPALANMRPQDVAAEVMQLAKISGNFQSRPVETMMQLVKQHGLEEPLRQALSGQAPQQEAMAANELRQQVSQLQRQLKQVSDPEYLRGQVEQFTTQTQLQGSVEQFAAQAPHWQDVEPHMPSAIAFVRESAPNASPQDVLDRAYRLAVSQFVPEATQAPTQDAAPQAAPATDPSKTEAARKAKSVNVRSTPTGKARTLTEEEELSRAYDRMAKS